MNAQREWKSTYKAMKKQQRIGKMGKLALAAWLHELRRYRREAALERIVARQARTIEGLTNERDDYKMHFEACDEQRLQFLNSLMNARAERDESSRQLKSRAEFTDYLEAKIKQMSQRIEALQSPNYTCMACGHFASDHDFDHGHPCGQCECTGYQSP